MEILYNQTIVDMNSKNSPSKSKSKLSYEKLEPTKTPRLVTKATNEQRFWKKYTQTQISTTSANVTCVCADRNQSDLMLFGHGRNVMLVDTSRKTIVRQIDHVANTVTALAMRNDGRLMALGDEAGTIEVKDTKEKFNLRTFKNHQKRINCLDFSVNDLYSGGDDMILRLFDVAAGQVIHSYSGAHEDYIKCVRSLENNHLLSGSYDGKIKLFDFRVHKKAQIEFQHGAQVQWFDLFPSKLNFVACGEKKITSWDIRSDKPLFENISNKKLVSCVRVASKGSRIISSSYDNYLKIYKSDTFQCTYQEKMESPILSFDITGNSQCIGIGLENKKMILKARAATKQGQSQDEDEKEIADQIGLWLKNNETKGKFAYNDKYFYRGVYGKPQNFDIKFERNQNKKISEYDNFLKKFLYKKALFTSLRKKNMVIFTALLDEYIQRGCLERMVKSLSIPEIDELLQILGHLIHDIRYSEWALQLLAKMTELQGKTQTMAWNGIKSQIRAQIEIDQEMTELEGMFDLIESNCV